VYDVIEVQSSPEAMVNLAVTGMDVIDVIRPAAIRNKILSRCEELLFRYSEKEGKKHGSL